MYTSSVLPELVMFICCSGFSSISSKSDVTVFLYFDTVSLLLLLLLMLMVYIVFFYLFPFRYVWVTFRSNYRPFTRTPFIFIHVVLCESVLCNCIMVSWAFISFSLPLFCVILLVLLFRCLIKSRLFPPFVAWFKFYLCRIVRSLPF